MNFEDDKHIINLLVANDAEAIEYFFFNCCRAALNIHRTVFLPVKRFCGKSYLRVL